jgi:hypothetical protein
VRQDSALQHSAFKLQGLTNESAAPLVLLLLLLWLLLQAGLLTSALLELIKLLLVDIDAQDHSCKRDEDHKVAAAIECEDDEPF